jgi:hypothetical protein
MSDFLLKQITRRVTPNAELSALTSIARLPDAQALEVWTQWRQQHNLDDINWQVHKVLARIGTKISRIAPECPYQPRVEGLTKAHWTHSQLMLRASRQGLKTLIDASIPVMLLKGAVASHANSVATPRVSDGAHVMSDMDVLVPRMLYPKAIHVLYKAGWRCKESVEMSAIRWRFSPGANVHKSPHGDLDVHHQPIHGAYVSQSVLDRCWQRAQIINYHGLSVRIPAIADQIVFAASHAACKSRLEDCSASWVFDLQQLLAHKDRQKDYQKDLQVDDLLNSASEFNQLLALRACINHLVSISSAQHLQDLLAHLMKPAVGIRAYVEFNRHSLVPRSRIIARYLLPVMSAMNAFFNVLPSSSSSAYGGENKWDVINKLKSVKQSPKSLFPLALLEECKRNQNRHEVVCRLPEGITRLKNLRCYVEIESYSAHEGRYKLDIAINHEACARLNCHVLGQQQSNIIRFCMPITADIQIMTIEAISQHTLTAQATAQQRHEWQPLRFNIQNMFIC